jgi:hypothetical protein
MNTETNKKEAKSQSLFGALSKLANGKEFKVVIGNGPEAGAVHLVIPRTLVFRTQTVNVAHLSGSG